MHLRPGVSTPHDRPGAARLPEVQVPSHVSRGRGRWTGSPPLGRTLRQEETDVRASLVALALAGCATAEPRVWRAQPSASLDERFFPAGSAWKGADAIY